MSQLVVLLITEDEMERYIFINLVQVGERKRRFSFRLFLIRFQNHKARFQKSILQFIPDLQILWKFLTFILHVTYF